MSEGNLRRIAETNATTPTRSSASPQYSENLFRGNFFTASTQAPAIRPSIRDLPGGAERLP